MRFNKICFVGFDTYPVLNPKFGQAHIGGESVQQTLLAKAFSVLGFQVSVIDKDYGQRDGEAIDGIKIWRTYRENTGIPILRFVHPRLSSLLRALKRADADVYYQSTAAMATGCVAWFSRRYNRKFIFRTAHDTDCLRGNQLIKYWRDRKIYEYGLRRADVIAVQSAKQKCLLHDNYSLNGIPVNMAVEIPREGDFAPKIIDVLWVNNLRPFKRPEILIEVARKLSIYRFTMIGGPLPHHELYYKKIETAAKEVTNLAFLGPVPYSRVNMYFSHASLFLNTSATEGFPNSFLQAWIRGVPVISFFDPDDLIKTKKLGYVAGNIGEMIALVAKLLEEEQLRRIIGERARHYALNKHSPTSVAREYLSLLSQLEAGDMCSREP